MGAWGYYLFQSHEENEIRQQIDEEAGKLANDPNFTFDHPKNKDEAVAKLDGGLFHRLLEVFRAKNWKHGIIYLGALSMLLGVKVSDEDMRVLRDTLPRTKMYDEAKAQMQKALDGYKNDGEAWNFETTMDTIYVAEEKDVHVLPGAIRHNLKQDLTKVPTKMPKDGEVEMDEAESEGIVKSEDEAKDGNKEKVPGSPMSMTHDRIKVPMRMPQDGKVEPDKGGSDREVKSEGEAEGGKMEKRPTGKDDPADQMKPKRRLSS